MRPFDGRRILLIVSGGIAAYKSAYLVRRLQEAGADLDVVLTRGGGRFVGEATFEGLTGARVHTDLWERPMAHVELGREAELAVVAPATADLIARLAVGRADDMATTTLLAADCPMVVCPAMNHRMWKHPATRRNVSALRERGVRIVGPEHGELAEGEVGLGRMAETSVVMAEAGRILERPSLLDGRKVVVTAGPTVEPIDPVRVLTNRSSGRMGYALAAAAWRRGAEVVLVSGPSALDPPHGPRCVSVRRSQEMLETLREELRGASLLLMAAAVSDFSPEERAEKIRKEDGDLDLSLERGPDLLSETRELRGEEEVFTLGFALEPSGDLDRARRKLEEKGMDLVAVNPTDRPDAGLGAATNQVTVLDAEGTLEELPVLLKEELADRLLDRVEDRMES